MSRVKVFLLGAASATLLLGLMIGLFAVGSMARSPERGGDVRFAAAPPPVEFQDDTIEGSLNAPGSPAMAPAPVASGERRRELSMKRSSVISVIRGNSKGGGGAALELDGAVGAGVGGLLGKEEPEPAAAPSRAWFPETFLFEPLVVTDASGEASVPVRVPDRLTRWRVLALAHSREGAQAGATAGFLGTLPTYVDPVIPPFLLSGDEIRLPVQVVNTTQAAVTRPLKVEANGALVTSAGGAVIVPAGGSKVEYVTLRAGNAGKVTLKATLGDADAVVRSFDVLPTGKPVTVHQGGSLGAPRSFPLEGPAGPNAGSERVRLLVYPGALALLRSELSAASSRGGVTSDAYALMLAGRAPELLRALGDTPDPAVLRELTLTTSQRVLKAARAPEPGTLGILAEAALSHPDNPVLSRLGDRLTEQLAQSQRPDGTCQGGDGWTLQRLLVATADCVRAVSGDASVGGKRLAQGVSLRAQGAFERHLDRVQDGYTAAAILAAGPLPSSLSDKLEARVFEALKQRADGSRYLPVEPEVQRADGQRPGEVEATALAVLALQGDPKAPLVDLGTSLLAGYRPGYGWGDGRANQLGLRAALVLFKDPLPPQVKVVLERDGKVITEGTLDAKALKEVLALEAAAPGSSGTHGWTVRAEPAVPGLGFSLALQAFVPWKKEERTNGLELAIAAPPRLTVGKPAEVTVSAAMPSGIAVRIRHALPAGVQPDTNALQRLVVAGTLRRFDVEDGAVVMEVDARPPGESFSVKYRVIPTLAGTLHAQASTVEPLDRPELAHHLPPVTWTVR
ncbi:MAG TPA: alpha-2-macroglobulin family protein [Myxococcaceae bacterium]|nr:alpha-2-macroglobulin family protein [Myxococcaceae bacterium]